jgi:Arm DNA-binding domain
MVRTDRDGLGARVSPKGKITFQLRYYYNGSEAAKRVDLGSYPAMPLVEARQETLRLRGLIEKGRYIEANPLADITGHEDLQIGSTCVDTKNVKCLTGRCTTCEKRRVPTCRNLRNGM